MLPDELYKRRHFGTPESVMLIVVNYVVVAVAIEMFALCTKINWFFWVVLGVLAFYNYYTIRRNRDEYGKNNIIGYVISIAGLLLMFFLFRLKAQNC
jgi:4-hydroxybenzoate polyprenyltransferase